MAIDHYRVVSGGACGRCGIAVLALAGALLSAGCDGRSSPASRRGSESRAADPAAAAVPVNGHIVVDQFGYRPDDDKVAVIRNPDAGFDAADQFAPGPVYDLRRARDGTVVYTGVPRPWNAGSVQASSGDRGWWFDFSSVSTPGRYFVADVRQGVRSPAFTIDAKVYSAVLKTAVRTYYYQRSGIAKQEPYAEPCWTDDPAYAGANQDGAARDVTDPDNPAKVRDLSGGWFDAGDTNKYVTFAVPAVHQLLTAYQENPGAFTDDFGIPESGNGIPDILDEIKWETDWLKKMQYGDGGAALKVGDLKSVRASPPSSDSSARYYVPSCTSATVAAAGMFAHAAIVFRRFPALEGEAGELKLRASAAWRNFNRTPRQFHCDANQVREGNADWDARDQNAEAVVAAIYLFALTGDSRYDEYLRANYHELRPYRDMGWSRYNAEQGEALLFYATLSEADPVLKASIVADKHRDIENSRSVYGFREDDDLYRAQLDEAQYHWGSNQVRANYGNSNLDVVRYDANTVDKRPYLNRAAGELHYLNGTNPFGIVYLTNMYSLGATSSVNEIFHGWFGRYSNRVSAKLDSLKRRARLDRWPSVDRWFDFKSVWSDARTSSCGPPPGYLPGGPNRDAERNGIPGFLKPPTGQPPQKSYRDSNVDWPDASWVVNEPAIYYQAAYIKLLSAFIE